MASTVSAVSFATSPICMLLVTRPETWGMSKGYTLECGPESRAFREIDAGSSVGSSGSLDSVIIKLDSISSPIFRAVESDVGTVQKRAEFGSLGSMKLCNSETGGYPSRSARKAELQRLEALSNALNRGPCLLFVDVGENQQEFLSS